MIQSSASTRLCSDGASRRKEAVICRLRNEIGSNDGFILHKIIHCPNAGYHDFILIEFLAALGVDRDECLAP